MSLPASSEYVRSHLAAASAEWVTMTHASDPVPYLMFSSRNPQAGIDSIDEESAKATGVFVENGTGLMQQFIDL